MAEKYVVEGYEFDTLEEANQAKVEMDAVKYMSQKTAGAAPEVALKIYRKIVDNNLLECSMWVLRWMPRERPRRLMRRKPWKRL